MNIVFFCNSCGARFEVPPSAAGKKGRCKKCGQMMAIPRPAELASMVAMPAMPSATAAGPHVEVGGGVGDWIGTAKSSVGLAPLTVDKIPIGLKKAVKPRTKWDDSPDDDVPYVVMAPRDVDKRGPVSRPVSGAKILWRKQLGGVQRAFRWLNETAYLISVPFLMVIVIGALSRSRPLAILGATVVVLLNLGRIAAGLANLVIIPFRDGISQGVMFLIPPLTFIYMSNHWNKLRKPTMRILGPAGTIALVVAAFAFIPSLGGEASVSGDLKGRLVDEAKGLKRDIADKVGRAKSLDVEGLTEQAGEEARKLRDQLRPPADGGAPAPKAKSKSAEDAVNGLLRGVEKRAREAIDESGQTP